MQRKSSLRGNEKPVCKASGDAFSFATYFRALDRKRATRIRKAGKHTCVKVLVGTVAQVTGKGDKILKRPKVTLRLYECKVCGRYMT